MSGLPASVPGPRSALSGAEVERYFETGFLVVRALFAPGEVERMRAAFERLARTAYRLGRSREFRGSSFVLAPRPDAPRGVVIERIVWCGAAERELSEFGMDRRLLALAACLLGTRRMSQLINQAHFKLPGDGVEFPWHQDSVHRRHGTPEWVDVNGRGSYVQTVLALDAVNAQNGPLELIPGSCRLGHRQPPPGAAAGWLPAEVDAGSAVAPALDPGDVLLFGPFTFHRSGPNRSAAPRRAFLNGYACPGANFRVYPGRGAGRLLYC